MNERPEKNYDGIRLYVTVGRLSMSYINEKLSHANLLHRSFDHNRNKSFSLTHYVFMNSFSGVKMSVRSFHFIT